MAGKGKSKKEDFKRKSKTINDMQNLGLPKSSSGQGTPQAVDSGRKYKNNSPMMTPPMTIIREEDVHNHGLSHRSKRSTPKKKGEQVERQQIGSSPLKNKPKRLKNDSSSITESE